MTACDIDDFDRRAAAVSRLRRWAATYLLSHGAHALLVCEHLRPPHLPAV